MISPKNKKTKTEKKPDVLKSVFGQRVDYHAFALKTKSSFYEVADMLGRLCHCTIRLSDDMLMADNCLNARFKVAYAQMKGLTEESIRNTVDRITLVLFQNITRNFDKSSIIRESRKENTLFAIQEGDLLCSAIGSQKITVTKWKDETPDFFILAYVQKQYDIAPFLQRLSKVQGVMKNVTHLLYGLPAMPKEGKSVVSVRMTDSGKRLQSIFNYIDPKINQDIQCQLKRKIGIVPPSLRRGPDVLSVPL